jgi:hemolysin III
MTSPRSVYEEPLNAISHCLMALASVPGLILLVYAASGNDNKWSLFSSVIYGSSLIILYTASGFYHAFTRIRIKNILRVVDHCSIYILIAGTYTPVVLLKIGGTTGWIFFFLQWCLAITGIIFKIFFTGRFEFLSVLIYIFMGWMIVPDISSLYDSLPVTGFSLLVAGGLTYTAGIIFYLIDTRMLFAHFIWHIFVLAGSILHYIFIAGYII